MSPIRRLGVRDIGFWLTLTAALGLTGCQPGVFGTGAAGGGTGEGAPADNTPEDEAAQPLPQCLEPNAGGGATPTADIIFPPEGVAVPGGEVTFLWSASDRERNNLEVTIVVGDQPDVFDNPMTTRAVCAESQTGLGQTVVQLAEAGTFFWGLVVTDGLHVIQRPADGLGVEFVVGEAVAGRGGLEGAILLCPRETQPARAATTFQWSLGDVQPQRTQVFVGRADQDNPFNASLRVFEVIPPQATSLTLSEAQALPVGEELSWGLRIETADAVLFTFEGQLGTSFLVAENVVPAGELLAPPERAVWADDAEAFTLSWEADPGNCEDVLTSTVYLEALGESGAPAALFESPMRLEVGPGSLEVNLVAANALILEGGVWAWGVLADDGTDQTVLPDSEDPGRSYRVFVRNTAPVLVTGPLIERRSCMPGGPALAAVAFVAADANVDDAVTATVTYAPVEGSVFDNPTASVVVPLSGPGNTALTGVVFLESAADAACTALVQGSGFYGVEISDGVNGPVRGVVEYEGEAPPPPTPTGACCAPDGSCGDVPAAECTAGAFQGDGTSCAATVCPVPAGACCLPDGTCTEGPANACIDGAFQGEGMTCAAAECPLPIGACCWPDGSCTEVAEDNCAAGTYRGDGTSCAAANCPQPPQPPQPITDCNKNEVADGQDIANGTSLDCNTNGVPDECEGIGVGRLYVDRDVEESGDGTSWETAYAELREALAAVAEAQGLVTEIWVADGVYTPTVPGGSQAVSFQLQNGLAIYGGFAGGEDCLHERVLGTFPSILSGDLNGDDFSSNGSPVENSRHVVAAGGTDGTALLDGFTVTGGFGTVGTDPTDGAGLDCGDGSPTLVNCGFQLNAAGRFGGAVYIGTGSPELLDCTFANNGAVERGGGVYNAAGSPRLTRCIFDTNASLGGGGMYNAGGLPQLTDCLFGSNTACGGAGLGTEASDPTLLRCTFTGNEGGECDGGGGVRILSGNPLLADCQFLGNNAAFGSGGGVYIDAGDAVLLNCEFHANVAAYSGGGVYIESGNPSLTNCLIAGNMASSGDGGAVNIGAGAAAVTNCTIVDNVAVGVGDDVGHGGGVCFGGFIAPFPSVTNCIAWGNSDDSGTGELSQLYSANLLLVVNYTCIQNYDNWPGVGNIGGYPQFVGATDFHLTAGSPCIDAGDNDAVPPGVTTDLDGSPRFVDDPDAPDCPQPGADCGTPPIVDMGAYEFAPD